MQTLQSLQNRLGLTWWIGNSSINPGSIFLNKIKKLKIKIIVVLFSVLVMICKEKEKTRTIVSRVPPLHQGVRFSGRRRTEIQSCRRAGQWEGRLPWCNTNPQQHRSLNRSECHHLTMSCWKGLSGMPYQTNIGQRQTNFRGLQLLSTNPVAFFPDYSRISKGE